MKLSEEDYEVLSNLAMERDIAVSTMARVLLRHAALAEAGATPTWRP